MNKIIVLLFASVLLLTGCVVKTTPVNQNNNTNAVSNENINTGLANPASVYCVEQGGKLEIRTDESGGQYGVCIFTDGSECEEWAYFRKECQPGGKKSEVSNFEECAQAGNPVLESYPRQCRTPDGKFFVEKIEVKN